LAVENLNGMVVGFQYLADAHRFLAGLKLRLEAFALELHPDKTGISEFGPFAQENRRDPGSGPPDGCSSRGGVADRRGCRRRGISKNSTAC
jgi:RNA-directed DNA polymerase